jgi:hypothetical protein
MKTLKLVFIAGVMLTCMTAQAQHWTAKLDNAELTYNSTLKKFVLSKVGWEQNNGQLEDAFIRIFIETGDGNYIQETADYSDFQSESCAFPKSSTFEYRAQPAYNATATLIKTYDKGGPRSRLLTANNFNPTLNPRASNGLYYPPSPVTLFFFDYLVVPEDTMTGIITINNNYLHRTSTELILNLDALLSLSNVRVANKQVSISEPELRGSYNTYRVTAGSIPETGIINIFFSILPSAEVANLSNMDRLYYELENYSGKRMLSIARSHDPNSIELLPDCQHLSTSTFTFRVNVENTGLAFEDDITVGLKFSTAQFLQSSIIGSEVNAVFGGTRRVVTVQSRPVQELPATEMNNCSIIMTFKSERLEGINRLPTGNYRTRGTITFTLKVPGSAARDVLLHMQAVVKFGKANEVTPTRQIQFTPQSIADLCHRINACSSGVARHCRVCNLVGAPGTVDAWYCK